MKHIHPDFFDKTAQLETLIQNFDNTGKNYGNQNRNVFKLFPFQDFTINVKSFKKPNLINRIVYRFFRPSKAERSFKHANILINKGFKTPQPIGYFEFPKFFSLDKSFYLSKHLEHEITFRDLTYDFSIPNHEQILRAFTKFSFDLHQENINFLDHSPGNTLIKHTQTGYDFYLVDLNRMNFKTMEFDDKMKNLSRLTDHQKIIEIIADEYSKLSGLSKGDIKNRINFFMNKYQNNFRRKRALKKKLKFWKKN